MAPPSDVPARPRASARHSFACRLDWTGAVHGATTSYAAFVREHRIDFDAKGSLVASAAAAFRGDDALLNPEELLLAALSSCHFMSYAAQCAWSGVALTGYSDRAELVLALQDGVMRVVEARLRPLAIVSTADQVIRALGLHARAHEGCFIARSVAFPVAIEPACEVVD